MEASSSGGLMCHINSGYGIEIFHPTQVMSCGSLDGPTSLQTGVHLRNLGTCTLFLSRSFSTRTTLFLWSGRFLCKMHFASAKLLHFFPDLSTEACI